MGTEVENAIIQIHGWLGNTSGYYAIIMALWGLWRIIRKQGINGDYWAALVIEECLIVLHCILGAFLYFVGANWDPPVQLDQPIHILYGVICALVLPAVLAITKGKKEQPQLIVYVVINAALALIVYMAIRASGAVVNINE